MGARRAREARKAKEAREARGGAEGEVKSTGSEREDFDEEPQTGAAAGRLWLAGSHVSPSHIATCISLIANVVKSVTYSSL